MFDQHLPARCKMSIANAKIIILQSLHRTTFGQVSNRKARSSQTLKSQLEDLFEDTRVGIGCRVYRRIFWRWYLQNMCIIIASNIYTLHIHIYIYIYWGVRELSIDMPSKLSKRQPYSQSMKEFKGPHVHKKVAIVHPKKHLMSTKRCLMSTKKMPNIHAFSFHFAATIRKISDILATSCPHICCQFWQQKSTYSGILAANCPHIGF